MDKAKSNRNFLLALLFLMIMILFPFMLFKDSLYVITTPSMTPTLNIGDLVIRGEKAPDNIHVGDLDGDILILKGPQYYYENGYDPRLWNYLANNTPIIHRAIDKQKIGDKWHFLTKGDNNKLPDGGIHILNDTEDYYLIEYNRSNSIYISETEVLGIVLFKIPYIGYLNIYFPVILIILILFSISYVVLKGLHYNIRFEKTNHKKR